MGPSVYVFGPYRFETQSRLLFHGDKRSALTPKAAELLLALLEHDGQLLSKDELLRLVWPETFVEEGNLSRLIFSLRKTLAENGEGRTYVETIPKRGYRFVAPLEKSPLPVYASIEYEEGTREQVIIEQVQTLRRPGTWIAVIGAVLVVASLAAAIFWARHTSVAPMPRAVLVLPLVNLSGNSSDEYFSDGLTEELISAISGNKGLRVIPRGTAFQFKGKAADVREAGRRLDADAVLEGGVRRDPDQVRVNLRLIRVSDGSTFWSQSFSRPATAAIAAQQEIARAVLEAVELNSSLRPPDRIPGTRNVEAYHSFLRARFAHQDQSDGSLARALALYREAVRLDPDYADAWAGQAACRVTSGYLFEEPPQKAYNDAVAAAQQALSLDPKCASAHTVLAKVKFYFLHDWAGARREYDSALQLAPNDPDVLHSRSHYWLATGRPDLAEEEGRRGLRIDPLNMMLGPHQAWVTLMTGQYDEAIRRANSVLQFNPMHKPTLGYLAAAYEEAGHIEQAIEVQVKLGLPAAVLADLRAAAGSHGTAGYCRTLAGYFEHTRRRPTAAARLYAIAGDAGNMIRLLERAVAEHDGWVVYVTSDAVYAPYRTDPRFRSVVRAVGFP
jgi:TolB-like protein/DNA-binding winged helix-turn-helix (wHTH) protein/Flp pilus assembly protein TadD